MNEHSLNVTRATLSQDRKSVLLQMADLQPTWCMEIKYSLEGDDGTRITQRIHNTVHHLGSDEK